MLNEFAPFLPEDKLLWVIILKVLSYRIYKDQVLHNVEIS